MEFGILEEQPRKKKESFIFVWHLCFGRGCKFGNDLKVSNLQYINVYFKLVDNTTVDDSQGNSEAEATTMAEKITKEIITK